MTLWSLLLNNSRNTGTSFNFVGQLHIFLTEIFKTLLFVYDHIALDFHKFYISHKTRYLKRKPKLTTQVCPNKAENVCENVIQQL